MSVRWNINTAVVDAGLQQAVNQALGPLPHTYTVISGYRTDAQQDAEYAKGRTVAGRIVTNAPGGQNASAHNVYPAMAVDFVPLVDGKFLWEPATHPAWQTAIAAVRAHPALESGAAFVSLYGDLGHVQLRNWKLRLPVTVPAEATATGAGDAPVPGQFTDPGTTPPVATSWLQLDPGVAIGVAALLGIVALLWLRGR